MSFMMRALIAILAGIGAGLIGFWLTWKMVGAFTGQDPGVGHDAWLLAGIFVPGVVVPLLVFRGISRVAVPPVA